MLFVVTSCHFYDDRIVINNDSDTSYYFAVWKKPAKGREDLISPFFLVNGGDKKELTLDTNLKLENINSDSIMVIAISPEAHDSTKQESGYYAFEELLKRKNLQTITILKSRALKSVNLGMKTEGDRDLLIVK